MNVYVLRVVLGVGCDDKKLTNGQYYMFDIVDCITAAITQLTFERTFIMTIPLYTGKLYRI